MPVRFVVVAVLVFCFCQHKLGSSGRRDPQLRECLQKSGLPESLRAIFLLMSMWPSPATVGSATPGQATLGGIRKVDEQ